MRIIYRTALVLAAFATSVLSGAEAPGPQLRQGLWRFERTFEYADGRAPGAPLKSENCGDPEAQAAEQIALMRRMGCTVNRSREGAAEWRMAVTCEGAGMPKGKSSSVQTVTSPDAYEVRVTNEGELASTIVRERLVAKRVGDC